jgi:DNA segregation ATPase FtsK/SpoIIIE, S-DNA-T family
MRSRSAANGSPDQPSADPKLPAWLDRVAGVLVVIRPYAEDGSAILLALLSALSLVALLGLAQGALIVAMAGLLREWLGWGAWLFPLAGFWLAWQLLRLRTGRSLSLPLGRIIAIELAISVLLALATVIFAPSLASAQEGNGGGLIGWGISFCLGILLSPFWQVVVLVPLFCGFIWHGLDLSLDEIRQKFGQVPAPRRVQSAQRVSMPAPTPAHTSTTIESKTSLPFEKPMRAALPREFRKDLKPASLATKEKPKLVKVRRDKALPPLDIFESGELNAPSIREINFIAGTIEKTLAEFGVPARVISYRTGPTVTQFGVEPGFVEKPGPEGDIRRAKVRVSQISSLANDLALALAAPTLRIEAPVPGQSYVGIEVPHKRSSVVRLRNVMESPAFQKIHSPLTVALGMDVAGQPVCADLATMPHLLIAGTTGSGKSVCITTITACLVANNSPETLRLVLIDPKMVELVRFSGLPHILGKVETDLERIVTVLRWCTKEMDRRYKLLEQKRARHIEDYNKKVEAAGEGESLPRMVILLDEMADLMMMAPDETERTLIRLAQMARAVGMHLVVATQRPSTDVVTGLIKANFPARIAFQVASSVDSRVILDSTGAETLLGKGDMLYLSPEAGTPMRMQGCFVTDREIMRLIDHWKEQTADSEPAAAAAKPEKTAARLASGSKLPPPEKRKLAPPADPAATPWEAMVREEGTASDEDEEQIDEAILVVRQYGRASASLLQRKMRLGYPRAAHIMDVLQVRGVIGHTQSGGKTREVLIGHDRESEE